ncbi:MAG: hypothetical protein IBJ09_06815 [Bacteroidia bacterium]|nr:hypothetical protein [Bacteroidia bacterium]
MKQWLMILAGLWIGIVYGAGESYAQKEGAVNKREIKRQQKETAKAAKRAYKYGIKRHMSIQSKSTRKRMKRNVNNSNRAGYRPNRKGL